MKSHRNRSLTSRLPVARTTRAAVVSTLLASLFAGTLPISLAKAGSPPTSISTADPSQEVREIRYTTGDPSAVVPTGTTSLHAPCGTPDASEEEAREVEAEIERFAAARPPRADKASGSITIRVYAHVIDRGPTLGEGNVPDTNIEAQIQVLNDSFSGMTGGAPTPFRFVLAGITRTRNAAWHTMGQNSAEERAAKSALRVGHADVLNLFITDCAPGLGGWGRFPWWYKGDPAIDGIVCDFTTITGVMGSEGDTTTHEVGHWLGLYHTFQGGCSGTGDYVADTPAVAPQTEIRGCPAGADTCPSSPGLDQIENFMDYTDEACQFMFTPGQAVRLDTCFALYRDAGTDDVAVAVNGRDIALTGPSTWASIPVAGSNGDGTFTFVNAAFPSFAYFAAQGAVRVSGDFDGDGFSDIALTGVRGWQSIPVAFSNRNGTFRMTNVPLGTFPYLASMSGVTVLAGDFNGDRVTDLALTGRSDWASVPVALSRRDGSFTFANYAIPGNFANFASDTCKKLVADFNGDGRDDIALTGGANWLSVPVAFSNGNGTFSVTNHYIGDFAVYAAYGATKLVGDFDGNGRADIALTGVPGWQSVPVAFSNGDGTFSVTNTAADTFAYLAAQGAVKIAGDFDGDGDTDIALTGVAGWESIPVAFSQGDGSFYVTNFPVDSFGYLATRNATVLAGDFDSDGRTDIALTGGTDWESIPVAFSNGTGSFTFTNEPIEHFGPLAAHPRATKLTGRFK